MSYLRILGATALGAVLLAAVPASAQPPHCPPGHAKKGWCSPSGQGVRGRAPDWAYQHDYDARWRNEDGPRTDWNDERDNAWQEGYRAGLHDAWRVGERLPDYHIVPDFQQYGWPAPADGRAYVEADGRYYLVNMATNVILDILSR